MVFTMDLVARENIVNPVDVLLEIFLTPSSGVRHVQIMATNGSCYQVKSCICFLRSCENVHRNNKNEKNRIVARMNVFAMDVKNYAFKFKKNTSGKCWFRIQTFSKSHRKIILSIKNQNHRDLFQLRHGNSYN